MDAKQVFRRASEKDPRISLATIYRNLRLFKELGLIEERRLARSGCSYEMMGEGQHHHLVCTACGRVIEFASCLFEELLAEVQSKIGFDVARATIDLEGNCRDCRDKEEADLSLSLMD